MNKFIPFIVNKLLVTYILIYFSIFQSVFSQQIIDNLTPKNVSCFSNKTYTLKDFYTNDTILDCLTDSIVNTLSDTALAGQMIVVAAGKIGKKTKIIDEFLKNKLIGGILLLKDDKNKFKELVSHFDSVNRQVKGIPLVYSADAEPSLINLKLMGSTNIPKTNTLKTVEDVEKCVQVINNILKEVGIQYNYAPVCDVSFNKEVIGNRSFGNDTTKVIPLCYAFMKSSQDSQIVATAKHFPGHGNVKGDSHHQLVYIDGALKELGIFKAMIDSGIISVMVGHIAVINNPKYQTEKNIPATCSEKIVTGLLRNKLGFKGIIITDAMVMGALNHIPNADYEAVKAGCDIILMPKNEQLLIQQMLEEMNKNEAFRERIKRSVRKIIRLKICLNLIQCQ